MVYMGHVENGVVVLDEPATFTNGTLVRVEPANQNTFTDEEETGPTIAERYAAIIGKAETLPSDAAENHDHYLYGVPKR